LNRRVNTQKVLTDMALARQRIQELEESELRRQKLDSDLKERVKELECLYGVSEILDRMETAREDVYSEVPDLVRSAFQHPEDTGVEITIRNRIYSTRNFCTSRWRLSRPIRIGRQRVGGLVVCHLGDHIGRNPFLKEERQLLKAVAKRLSIAVERLKMGAQMKNSERFYRSLFENANDGIFLHYPDGRIGMANRAMAKITDYSVKELLGMKVADLMSPEPKSVDSEVALPRKTEGRTSHHRQVKMTTRKGDVRFVEVTDNRLTSADRIVVTQTIVRDMTMERRRADSIHAYAGQVITAQENERKRIARELHDETIQALLSLGMDIDAVISTEKALPLDLATRLGELRNRTRDIREGVKNLTRALRPPMLDEVGLLTALRWLTTDVTAQRGVDTKLEVRGEARRLSPEAEVTIFRVVQEALNNVAKHSGARTARVVLQFDREQVKLVVSDDGRGFDLSRESEGYGKSGRIGIIGMNERARLLNGTISFDSTPDLGTTVVLEAPV
jgi:two-component system sensor histidine kinase DegS